MIAILLMSLLTLPLLATLGAAVLLALMLEICQERAAVICSGSARRRRGRRADDDEAPSTWRVVPLPTFDA